MLTVKIPPPQQQAASIQHFIFDLDGTLIDSAPAILASYQQSFAQLGITPVRPITADIIGPPMPQTIRALCGKNDAHLINEVGVAFRKIYDSHGYQQTQLFTDVKEVLMHLSGKAKLYIATNKRILPTRLILKHLGIDSLFSAVYALDITSPPYVDKAAMIAGLLADYEITPWHAAYIGDRHEDGAAAEQNSLRFYAASWGYGDIEQLAEGWSRLQHPTALLNIQ